MSGLTALACSSMLELDGQYHDKSNATAFLGSSNLSLCVNLYAGACKALNAHMIQCHGKPAGQLTNIVCKGHIVEDGVVAVCNIEGTALICDRIP